MERNKMKKLLFVLSLIALSAHADDEKLNRIKLLMGVGPTDVSVDQTANFVKVQQANGFVFGVSYDRKLENRQYNVGGQILSNGTALMSVGVDF